MAPRTSPPPGQLDIPLVWETGSDRTGSDVPEPQHDPAAGPQPLHAGLRLWVAVLADAGVVVLAVVAFWGLAAALGVTLGPLQLGLTATAGVAAASVVALGCLWGWRASPGMLLLGMCFERPIPFGRVCRTWVLWLVSILVAGLPLLVRYRGGCIAERLAGGGLSLRSFPGSA